ncbi:hypothetical protein NC653_034583 [Populus alba x Populus x berolinensis]|uniref:Uncharacterized protein n=1 Tax=Populus alba x Populus x berolinensis TaxID=444605 RepID=A0AAD6PXA3_9ROSI|nr:hypothetical protein NC653_034583 [Populus alba x Populus x berolinensis]
MVPKSIKKAAFLLLFIDRFNVYLLQNHRTT